MALKVETKIFIVALILTGMTFSCGNAQQKSTTKTDKATEKKYIWVQYKRVPVIDSNDTIPVKNCYLIIESNIVSRYIDETLTETHTLIRDNRYSFPSYYFKDNPDNILQYLDKEQVKLVIKRDNFDGLQEYYIKKEL